MKRILAALALCAVLTPPAQAQFAGATVDGSLTFPNGTTGNFGGSNYFDPLNGYVPAGYSNSSSASIVLSGTGQGNFAFELQGTDSWLAEFNGSQLDVTFTVMSASGLSGSQLTFQSPAFAGLSIVRTGSDGFLGAGNGEMTATLVDDTVTLTVGPQCLVGLGCAWPEGVYTNTYSLAAGPQLTGLTLPTAVVAGCKSVTGTVTLSAPAPAAGTVVSISDTLTAATTPLTVPVPAGATSKTFSVKTVPVAVAESGVVSATVGGTTLIQNLTVRPMGLRSITLTPSTVAGGNTVAGTATLECKAGPGAILVDLASSNAAVASPVAANIAVPQGLQLLSFDVSTSAVLIKSTATISGTANGTTKSRVLTVTPAASVSPTSLKFGSVPVNTTSGVLNATLTNKGVTAFSVSSIGLTGTNAKYYAQTNNCPATLAAGASCTIGVTFKPTVTGSKSATLSIATSATSTPFKVPLSGTGL